MRSNAKHSRTSLWSSLLLPVTAVSGYAEENELRQQASQGARCSSDDAAERIAHGIPAKDTGSLAEVTGEAHRDSRNADSGIDATLSAMLQCLGGEQ